MTEEKTNCPDCGGKGHKMGVLALLLNTIVGAVLAATETDNPHGITRQTCERCKGTGKLPVEE